MIQSACRRPAITIAMLCLAAFCCGSSLVSITVIAPPAQNGSAEEAKTFLVKAAAAVKADKTEAVDMFNKGEGGFVDRDLYVFCIDRSDDKVTATENSNSKSFLGQDVRTVKDADGKAYGPEF